MEVQENNIKSDQHMEPEEKNIKSVVCGIGNTLRGDDAFGPEVIAELHGKVNENTLLINCSTAPENFIQKIIKSQPDKVIVIDAIDAKEDPGTVLEIPLQRIAKMFATTHKLPISMFISRLTTDLPEAKIIFFGVVQKQTGFGMEMSSECCLAKKSLIEKVLHSLEG